ncbi:ankyrin repeat domain-containing protein [Paenibacillus paeoniae]|uniref:Ankyrin repeat domain-containing protein n=1 Tax=Paenibacillus paeoniae TaxID=2292705 RepID=A0A371P6Y7_9BACL|nr:ankyrin repeat domain-containing protein [Paenibacillus paeoniae]
MDKGQVAKEIRLAIKRGHLEKVSELIGNDSEVLNLMTTFGNWLHVAASEGQLEIAKKLINLGIDVNGLGGVFGGGALNEAASEGHIDIVRYLLSCGAELDVSEPERNPLFGAISNGHTDITHLLIKSGIDMSVKYSGESMKNMDALHFAREMGQMEVVKLLGGNRKSFNSKEQ